MLDNTEMFYNGLKVYKLTYGAYEHYRTRIKGNKEVTHNEARRKLTRNINLAILSNEWTSNGSKMKLYCYGCLHIIIREDTIIRIKYGTPDVRFKFNQRQYDRLTKRLDLDSELISKTELNKLRKRKIAKVNKMRYCKSLVTNQDGSRVYYLEDVSGSSRYYGTLVNKPYSTSFIKGLQWLKDNR